MPQSTYTGLGLIQMACKHFVRKKKFWLAILFTTFIAIVRYFVNRVLLAWYATLSLFTSLCCNSLEHSDDSSYTIFVDVWNFLYTLSNVMLKMVGHWDTKNLWSWIYFGIYFQFFCLVVLDEQKIWNILKMHSYRAFITNHSMSYFLVM